MFPNFCNNCFRRHTVNTNSQLQLSISSCGHIMCAECVQPKCQKCGRLYKATVIDRNMPPTMVRLFEPPFKQFEQYLKTVKFQLAQQAIFNHFTVKQLPCEMRNLQRESQGFLRLAAQLQESIEKEKKRNEKLKAYLAYHVRRKEQPNVMEPPRARSLHSRLASADVATTRSSPSSAMMREYQGRIKPQTPTLSVETSSSTIGSKRKNNCEFNF